MSTVNNAVVTTALVELLRSQLPVAVGDGHAPDSGADALLDVKTGWLVVRLVPSGRESANTGYFGQSDSMKRLRFQLVGAGIQRDQAQSIASMASAVLVDRGEVAGSGFVHDLSPLGHHVMDRYEAGSIPTETLGTTQAGGFVELLVSVA